jgi:hypothetical protein
MKLYEMITPISTKEQYKEFHSTEEVKGAIIHKFEGVDDYDVYNPSIPFVLDGSTYIAGRVERRVSEKSKVMFFKENEGKWMLCQNTPTFDLQDPFVTWIDGELIFGGVRVDWDDETGEARSWCTDFFRGTNLNNLTYFTSGPSHMKDIRLVQLHDKRIGIFTRPQGYEMLTKYRCIAKIGFTIVNILSEVTPENIEKAPLLEGHFLSDEWGGCNQVHLLKDGTLGVIGHKSYGEGEEDNKILHYYGMAFVIDPYTRKMSIPKIIISRECFPAGPAKAPRLTDVTFTSGIVRGHNNIAVIYTGLSDAQVGSAMIKDPFVDWENRREIMI